jgi:nucleoside-diphosphate-sugar epimerase
MRKTVLILGANGRLGLALIHAFKNAGWDVVAHGRGPTPSDLPEGIVYDRSPLDPARWSNGSLRPTVVVHAINPHYTRWAQEALPALRAGIAIAKVLGARLMFPGNVYNYGFPMPSLIGERSPQRATTRKGKIRVSMENMLAAEAANGLRSVILRAGDFIGAERPGGWFDLAITRDLAKGALCYPGPLDQPHAWQDVDTLAATFVAVAARETSLPDAARFNVAGHAITGEALLSATRRNAHAMGIVPTNTSFRIVRFPWAMFMAGQWFVANWRELLELRGLWQQAHTLDGRELHAFLGADMPAMQSLETVVERALRRDPRFHSVPDGAAATTHS